MVAKPWCRGPSLAAILRPSMRCLFALKDGRRLALVGGAFEFLVSTLLGHPDRGQILGTYQTDRPPRLEVIGAPSDGSANCLRRKSSSMGPGGKRPTDFGRTFERGFDLPLEVGKPHLSDKSTGGPIAGYPITKPHH